MILIAQSCQVADLEGFFLVPRGILVYPGNQLTDDWQDLHASDLGGLEAPF